MSGRFSRLPAAAVMDSRLSAAAIRVLAALGIYADKQGHCWPSVGTIAKLVGIHHRGVQKHIRKLEGTGYVLRQPCTRATSGGWGRNRYLLLYPPLPAQEPPMDAESDMAPSAMSSDSDASQVQENDPPMRHEGAVEMAPDATPPMARGATQTAYKNISLEKHPNGADRARSCFNGASGTEESSWRPTIRIPSPCLTSSAWQKENMTSAPSRTWRPPKPAKPRDRVTDLANQLAVVPGFDRQLAWQAIFALPDPMLAKIEVGTWEVPELLAELSNLDLNERARRGLESVQEDDDALQSKSVQKIQ